jgi:adenylate cyclase
LFNEETQQLERIAAIGENIQTNVVFKPNEGIAGSVFTSGKAEIINHVSLDSRFIPKHVQIGSMLCAPIKTIEKTIGVICLSHHEPIDYTAADLKLFSVLVSQASSAIENAILHERTVREEKIKSHLERYVSAQVVNAIMGGAGQEGVTLNSEKRNISILFSDIRGFTRLCETMEPEEIVEHLNTYFESMVDVIFAHQGTVNKFVGDMIVALFGAPARLQNSETYAVAAAIDMQKWLQAGAKTWVGKNFNTGIGLNSGNVVVGNVGSPKHMDYTAIGDEVNLASRLQSIAKGGQILVSQSVYNATKEEFSYQHHGCIQVKGKEKPVDVYEVIY